ncbi:MAG: TolC family protein [Flavobacteriaceae bacterium]
MRLFYNFTTILLFFTTLLTAQNNLNFYIEKAYKNNLNLNDIAYQIKFKNLDISKIEAQYNKPKIFVSADYLFTPYFNNNGQLVSTNPSNKAIGYDVGITNGGNYSALLNAELPILNKKVTTNLKSKIKVEVNGLKTNKALLKLLIKKNISFLYLETYRQQIAYATGLQNLKFLKTQLKIIKALTNKGIYKLTDYQLFKISLQTETLNLERLKATLKIKMQQLQAASGVTNTNSSYLENSPISLKTTENSSSLFLESYKKDSLGFELNKKIFNNNYLPQIKFYTNTGLNATSLTNINRKIGFSAGLQLSYTLFDGHQKKINTQQQQLLIDKTQKNKQLKKIEIQINKDGLLNTIIASKTNLESEHKFLESNKKILNLFKIEVQKAQVSIINYLSVISQYNQSKLNYEFHKIDLYELINDYNYLNN